MAITFVIGGARSGKSSYAAQKAEKCGQNIAYIATCSYFDEEMQVRIAKHQQDRPKHWHTYEEFEDLAKVLSNIQHKYDAIIIDCLTLFISGFLLNDLADIEIENKIQNMLQVAKQTHTKIIIVSNEVGLGLHPDTPLGRRFRDLAGRVNQLTAHESDEVLFMVAGMPLIIK